MMSKIRITVAPKLLDAGSTTTKRIHYMGGSLTTLTAPQMTDVIPNRWGEPPPFRAKRRSGICQSCIHCL